MARSDDFITISYDGMSGSTSYISGVNSLGAKMPSGNKPVVICNGQVHEADDLKKAQEKAEQLAHQSQAEAYILKPVKKVAPKREVVTTDIE